MRKSLISKQSTDFVAHNMLLNYCLWNDNALLIESFVLNNDLGFKFNPDHYHFCITGIDSKYNDYQNPEPFDHDVKNILKVYSEIDKMLAKYGYVGTSFLIKVDNSKKVAIIFSSEQESDCLPCIREIDSFMKNNYPDRQKYICTSLVCDYHGYENIHIAYEACNELNKLSFFGIDSPVILASDIQQMSIASDYISIDANCVKLQNLCCYGSLEDVINQTDFIFNRLIRYSFNIDYFKMAASMCEKLLAIIKKVYVIEELPAIYATSHFDYMEDYVDSLKQRFTLYFQNVNKRYSYGVLLALNFILDNFTKDISLNITAEYTNISTTALSSAFNQEVHCSFSSFISNLRLNQAKQYLLEGIPPQAIYSLIGFTSLRYFTNVFKQEYGITPLQFQKAHKK